MNGNLMMNIENNPSLSLRCRDLKENMRFSVLLGSITNMIFHQTNHPVALQTSNGLLCHVEDLIKFSPTISVYEAVDMNDKCIFILA